MTLAQFLKANVQRYRRKATGYVDGDLRRMFHKTAAAIQICSAITFRRRSLSGNIIRS